LQLTFARSQDRVFSHDITITRVAVTRPEDAAVSIGEEEPGRGKQTEMGRKALVPYGLYIGRGFFNPLLAKGTGFSDEDLALFWEALQSMFELDRSASRGLMALRGLFVFTHEKPTGNAPAHLLFERIEVRRKKDDEPPRSFADYEVSVDDKGLPPGIALTRLIG